jgi:hypothetical protein
MGKTALGIFAAALLVGAHGASQSQSAAPQAPAAAQAGPSNVVPNKIVGYTAWDDEYLYLAIQVTKPIAAGTNSAPFSNPLEDDAIVISVQTDNDHKSTARTEHTFTIAVSAAGGTQIYRGEKSAPLYNGFKDLNQKLNDIATTVANADAQEKARVALLATVPKVTVNPIGGSRPGAGEFPGYTFEIAIPWVDLGGKPESESRFGFNVAAISKSPGSPKVLSLSPLVRGNTDLDNPSLFSELQFSSAARGATRVLFTCPRVIANKPTIDGVLLANEWNRLSAFNFGEEAHAISSAAAIAATVASRSRADFAARPGPAATEIIPAPAYPAATAPHSAAKVEQLVLAKFDYDYQADVRKGVQTARVTNLDHSSALAHHPLEGTGPWFSYERANWHRDQLIEAHKSGIDVVLPVYRADSVHKKQYADRGLMILGQTLQSLDIAGIDCPQVGMYLDTASLEQAVGDKVSLNDPASQELLFGAIRDFYVEIPQKYRCLVSLAPGEKAVGAYPVFLSDASAFKQLDAAGLLAVRNRFRQEFSGVDLLFVGVNNFGASPVVDSAVAGGGWFKTARVNPGFDLGLARLFSPNLAGLTSRKGGDAYRSQWIQAIQNKADWVLLDTWNDFSLGGELAPSTEEGFGTSDQTKIFTRMFNGVEKLKVKLLGATVPSMAAPHSSFNVAVRVQNAGSEGWPAAGNVALGYRWLKGGSVVAAETAPVSAGNVASGGDASVVLKVSTAVKGVDLPEGDYVLEIVASQRGSSSDLKTFFAPVTIKANVSRPDLTVVSTDLPRTLENGSVYTVHAVLRNDTGSLWKAGSTAILRIVQMKNGQLAAAAVMPSADASATIGKDLAPGDEAILTFMLPVMDGSGKPLAIGDKESASLLAARFEISGGNGPAAASQPMPLQLADFDFGVRFTEDVTPSRLPGERKQPVRLAVMNTGPQLWKKESVRIGYHWFYQDGSEFLWEDESTPLPNDLAPGAKADVLAWITAPPCDGTYFLVWDVKFGDTWASTSAATGLNDEHVQSIQVVNGRLTFIDLSKHFNMSGITDMTNLSAASFDGKGWSFPMATIPPFTDDGIVPSGIWQAYDKTGPESPRRISFKWGSKEGAAKSFIACRGQRLDFKGTAAKCRVLHIVAAATGSDPNTNIKLVFQEPSGESEDLYAFSVSQWDHAPVNGESLVYSSSYHHTPEGPKDGTVSLYHYQFVIRDPRKLVALKLPNDPSIKIAAITLER